MVTLLCTVRDCRQPLAREERRLVCPRGHSFDVARSGYCNLLQPQDRRSRQPGDSKEAVAARRRFADRGFLEPLVRDMIETIRGPGTEDRGPVLDVGCGDGYHLAAFQKALGGEGHGIDISIPAIDAAAKRYRQCQFIIANADRFLPYAGRSFALVASITSRMNPGEFRRVIASNGTLLVAIPGPDDLIELREAVLGEAKQIDRADRTIEAFASDFTFLKHAQTRHVAHLDHQAIRDVMESSYRGLRTRQRERLAALADLDVTLSRDLLVFTSS
ncbi:MAG TPA: methyltransferase domain-containing protein [Thermoanaerobaculia bacterium]|nr:methyltransferase domain-containing protein [Thermoanaerobaculia bacterium]